jgi:hypothetical protein
MSNFTTLYNTAGLPIGSIARGRINDPTWLPMNGGLYLKADYPELDTSQYLTFGNNTVQTAAGTTPTSWNHIYGDMWAHNDNYSTLILASAASSTYLHSTDGGVTWVQRTHTIGGLAQAACFVNNLFILITSTGAGFSSDGITWTSFPAISQNGFIDFFNGLYIWVRVSVSNTESTVYTSPTLAGATWTARFGVAGASGRSSFSLLPNADGGLLRNGDVLQFGHTDGGGPSYQIVSTTDGIVYYSTAVASPSQSARLTSSGFVYNTSSVSPSRADMSRGTNGLLLYIASSGHRLNNLSNLWSVSSLSGNTTDRMLFSENKSFGEVMRNRTLPSSINRATYFTPSRIIMIPTNSVSSAIYYMNIDTLRFRLERPYMDGRFVDDAYIKAA